VCSAATPKADGTSCSDGSACTQTDTCQTGACVGSNPVVCPPLDQCHDAGVCDPGSGICSDPNRIDGTACNDGDATTCNDVCTTGVCAGTFVAQPPELDNSVHLAKSPTDTTFTWNNVGGPYNVYRGTIGRPWPFDHACFASNLTSAGTVDAAVPSIGAGFYYLVSRMDQCRESSLGTYGTGTERPNASPCPLP
jgi:hypothetical protein